MQCRGNVPSQVADVGQAERPHRPDGNQLLEAPPTALTTDLASDGGFCEL